MMSNSSRSSSIVSVVPSLATNDILTTEHEQLQFMVNETTTTTTIRSSQEDLLENISTASSNKLTCQQQQQQQKQEQQRPELLSIKKKQQSLSTKTMQMQLQQQENDEQFLTYNVALKAPLETMTITPTPTPTITATNTTTAAESHGAAACHSNSTTTSTTLDRTTSSSTVKSSITTSSCSHSMLFHNSLRSCQDNDHHATTKNDLLQIGGSTSTSTSITKNSTIRSLDLDACSTNAAYALDSTNMALTNIKRRQDKNNKKTNNRTKNIISSVSKKTSSLLFTSSSTTEDNRSSSNSISKKKRSSSSASVCSNASSSSMNEKSKVRTYILKGQWCKLRKYLETNDGQDDLAIQATSLSNGSVTPLDLLRRASTMSTVSNGSNCTSTSNTYSVPVTINEPTLLHVACQNHPPLDIIIKLCNAQPSWVYNIQNSSKHTPLHVACKWGAHPSIIEYLLLLLMNVHNDTTTTFANIMTDIHGRTPLHLHCEFCSQPNTCDPFSYTLTGGTSIDDEIEYLSTQNRGNSGTRSSSSNNNNDDDDHRVEDDHLLIVTSLVHASEHKLCGPIPLVVDLLYKATPQCINQRDKRNCCPIDYCLKKGKNSVSRSMIQYLMQLSEQQHWNEKSLQDDEGEEDNYYS